jgi:hypothetical protein
VDDSKFSAAAANAVFGQVKPNGTEVKLLRILEPFPVAEAKKRFLMGSVSGAVSLRAWCSVEVVRVPSNH